MSSQRGNVARNRPQKHKNRTVFKNDLHDKSNKMKLINSIQVGDVCARCKDIIEWKIKYKKYKPLSQPKSCVKCSQKTVKKAYHVMCFDCVQKYKICAKCLQAKEVIQAALDQQEQIKLDAEMKALLQTLPLGKRQAFLRYMNKQQKTANETSQLKEEKKDDLLEKLREMSLKSGQKNTEEEDDIFGSDFDDGEEENQTGDESDSLSSNK